MKSAFFFHGLTDMIPDECDLATTRDAAKIKDKKYYVPDDFFKEGIETADYKGYSIRIHFFKVVEIVGILWIDAFMYAEKLSVFFGARVLSQWGQVRRQGVVTSSPEQKV